MKMIQQQIQSRLDEYVRVFDEAKKLVNDDAVAIAIVGQIGKHLRVEQMAEQRRQRFQSKSAVRSNENGDEILATTKQLGYLKKLGVGVPTGLTKSRASELIDEAQEAK